MNARAKKIREELEWQVVYARQRREDASPDGRAAHQDIPTDLLDAMAVVIERETRSPTTP